MLEIIKGKQPFFSSGSQKTNTKEGLAALKRLARKEGMGAVLSRIRGGVPLPKGIIREEKPHAKS